MPQRSHLQDNELLIGQASEIQLPAHRRSRSGSLQRVPQAAGRYEGNAVSLRTTQLHHLPRRRASRAIREAHGCSGYRRQTARMRSLPLHARLERLVEVQPRADAFPFARHSPRGGVPRLSQTAQHGSDDAACRLHENPRQLRRLSPKPTCGPVRRACQRLRRMPRQ